MHAIWFWLLTVLANLDRLLPGWLLASSAVLLKDRLARWLLAGFA
jgi:hypothetical protein